MTRPVLSRPAGPPDAWGLPALSPERRRTVRRLAWAGILGVAVAALAIGLLHVLPPSAAASPLSRTISEYSLYPDGWLFDVGVLVLAAGSGAVAVAIRAADLVEWPSTALIMTSLWSVGLVGLIVFPKYGFGSDATLAGRVHWTWTLLAFFSLPIGALGCCWRRRSGLAPGPWPRSAAILSWAAGGWFVVLAGQTVVGQVSSLETWHYVGLVERGLSLTEMATVVALAGWLLDLTRSDPERRSPDTSRT